MHFLFVADTVRSACVQVGSGRRDRCIAVRVHLPLVTRDDVQLSRATRHAPWKAKARGCLSPCTAWRRVLFSADEVEEALHLRPWPGGISGDVRR